MAAYILYEQFVKHVSGKWNFKHSDIFATVYVTD